MASRPVASPPWPASLARPAKQAIIGQVVALFNDKSRGERPVMRRADGLFGPQAVAWRVHADVTSMMVGGIAGLLLQMLHPAVLAGVWDHSNFRADMHGRLRRTARFIALTTYGGRAEAEAAIARVRGIHGHVRGVLPSGVPYVANDPALLAWVHVTEATSFLNAWLRYGEPGMSAADQDRYFAEMAQVAEMLGADPAPRSRAEALRLIDAMRPVLLCDARTREVAQLVLNQPAPSRMAEPLQAMAMQAGIDLLPPWARRMHGLQPGARRAAGARRHAGPGAHAAVGVHVGGALPSLYKLPAPDLARAMIGMRLLVDGVGGQVVETEAYDRTDPASHSAAGRTARNAAMFGPPGHAYVYRSYGLHWCLNVVCGVEPGAAVLIRALEPEHGLDDMRVRRGAMAARDLCRGPGRLCQALAVTGALDGCAMGAPPFTLLVRTGAPEVAVGRRVGITRGVETPWRFGLAGSRFLSRPLRG